MKFLKVFLKNWLVLSLVLFFLIFCTISILLFNAQNGYPKNMELLFIGNEVNIPLVLCCSAIISVLVGLSFAIYDFYVPKNKLCEEEC